MVLSVLLLYQSSSLFLFNCVTYVIAHYTQVFKVSLFCVKIKLIHCGPPVCICVVTYILTQDSQ